jgi:hypothetical protein
VRLSVCDTLLERLAQHLQDVAAALRPCIQEESAVVRQRHLPRLRHRPAADQAHIRDGVRGGPEGPGGDQGGPGAGEARDAVDTRGLDGLGEGHSGQEGAGPPGQIVGKIPCDGDGAS